MSGIKTIAVAVPVLCLLSSAVSSQEQASGVPTYTSDGGLKLPEHYREWVYLSTGFDMSYRPDSWGRLEPLKRPRKSRVRRPEGQA